MRAALLLCLLATGCRSRLRQEHARDAYVSAGLSALPQVGASVGAGWRAATPESYDLYVEAEGAVQFLDDTDFNDDGFGGSGTFTQASLGLKHALSPGHKRHVTVRYGVVWFRAPTTPTILDAPGDYVGCYVGLGFETELSERWTMGPEIRVLAVYGTGSQGFDVVPQFVWRLIFKF